MSETILDIKNLCLSHTNSVFRTEKDFSIQNISFQLKQSSSISLLGESASGKTSLIMALLNLHPIDKGKILYKEKDITTLSRQELHDYRRNIQPVFQNYEASINPYLKIKNTLFPGFSSHLTKSEKYNKTRYLLNLMNLEKIILEKHPHELSGGEKQRISLLRALITEPEVIILDEPFSALDIVNQENLLQLLMTIKKEFNVAYLLITHKIPLTRFFADQLYMIQKDTIHCYDNYNALMADYD